MTTVVQIPRATTSELDSIVIPQGNIRMDTQRRELRVGDGVTPGGLRIPNMANLIAEFVSKSEGLGSDVGFPESGQGFLIRIDDAEFIVRTIEIDVGLELANADGVSGNPTITIDFDAFETWLDSFVGSAAEIRANTAGKLLIADQVFAANGPVALVDAGTVLIDFAAGWNFYLSTSASRTLGTPSNVKYQSGIIEVINTGGVDQTLNVSGGWNDPSGMFPVTIPAGATIYCSYFVNNAGTPVMLGVVGA